MVLLVQYEANIMGTNFWWGPSGGKEGQTTKTSSAKIQKAEKEFSFGCLDMYHLTIKMLSSSMVLVGGLCLYCTSY